MLGCGESGTEVLLSTSDNPKRKLKYTWELVRAGRSWVCINTARANRIVEEALTRGAVPELAGYDELRREVPCGESSRIDFLLTYGARQCFVEVKNVTLAEGRTALFPDAVTVRGAKHLRELVSMVRKGHRAAMFYLINRGGCRLMGPAASIDPVYADALAEAMGAGVEVLAYRSRVNRREVVVRERIPFRLRTS